MAAADALGTWLDLLPTGYLQRDAEKTTELRVRTGWHSGREEKLWYTEWRRVFWV